MPVSRKVKHIHILLMSYARKIFISFLFSINGLSSCSNMEFSLNHDSVLRVMFLEKVTYFGSEYFSACPYIKDLGVITSVDAFRFRGK